MKHSKLILICAAICLIGLVSCSTGLSPTLIPIIVTPTVAQNVMWTRSPVTPTPSSIREAMPTQIPTATPYWVYDNPPISRIHTGQLMVPTTQPYPPVWVDGKWATPTPTPYRLHGDWGCPGGFFCLRWFIGFGSGANTHQSMVEQQVEDDFLQKSFAATDPKDAIYFFPEVVPSSAAEDALATEFFADNGPDVIGPIGWYWVNIFRSQLLDLKQQIAGKPALMDGVNPALLKNYHTTVPFAVYPSAVFYNPVLFDKAGLPYPPSSYGANLGPATYPLDGRNVLWDWETIREVSLRLTLDAAGRNATESGFDRNKIVQYGFTWNFEDQPSYLGTFWGNGAYANGKTAQLPEAWKAAWAWTYDGIWGAQPFIPSGPVSYMTNFDYGNPFNSGRVAITIQPAWYTCCIEKVPNWQIGALPAYNGKVAGRVDADFFVIWKGTKQPDASFKALTYLNTTAVKKLLIGSKDQPAAYNGIPARTADQALWLDVQKARFPWVKHWEILLTNLSFPDSPSAEAYMPNYKKSWARGGQFYERLVGIGGLDLEKEEAIFLADLQKLFDKSD